MKFLGLFLLIAAVCHGSVIHKGSRADGSCADRCGDNDSSLSCQCNSDCENFSDCCPDYTTICYSCSGRCNDPYNYAAPCACNDLCTTYSNCCSDYDSLCAGGTGGSCSGRCDDAYDSSQSCQCNTACSTNGDCCSDYSTVCTSSGGVTDQDILDFTEQLYTIAEPDLVGELIVIDSNPPGPLFVSVDETAFNSDTMQTFLSLRLEYDSDSCDAEDVSLEFTNAKDAFLDACMATDVMNATETFLSSNGLISEPLRDVLDRDFFDQYTRCSPVEGSSGFEHSFVGEIDENEVKGFHNWVSFYLDEAQAQISYTGFLGELDVSTKLNIFMMSFEWFNYSKPISSMWIGSTPELELALYVTAFTYKPNSLVYVSQNGISYRIQTYTQAYNSETLVGSAYPDIP